MALKEILSSGVDWIQGSRTTGSSGKMKTRVMDLRTQKRWQLSWWADRQSSQEQEGSVKLFVCMSSKYRFLDTSSSEGVHVCCINRKICISKLVFMYICMYACCFRIITSGLRIMCRPYAKSFGLLSFSNKLYLPSLYYEVERCL